MKFVLAVFDERIRGSAKVFDAINEEDAEIVASNLLVPSSDQMTAAEIRDCRGQWWTVLRLTDTI